MACDRTLTKRKKHNVCFKNRATGDMHEHDYAQRLLADLTKIEGELTAVGRRQRRRFGGWCICLRCLCMAASYAQVGFWASVLSQASSEPGRTARRSKTDFQLAPENDKGRVRWGEGYDA
jgi:hypothetical protein